MTVQRAFGKFGASALLNGDVPALLGSMPVPYFQYIELVSRRGMVEEETLRLEGTLAATRAALLDRRGHHAAWDILFGRVGVPEEFLKRAVDVPSL